MQEGEGIKAKAVFEEVGVPPVCTTGSAGGKAAWKGTEAGGCYSPC